MSNDLPRPDSYFLLENNSIKAISDLTGKELRQAHNLQKMYKMGAFNGNKKYKAFIVEGEAREPQIIYNISKIFFADGNYTVITLPAGEKIYMLWKQLKADDFSEVYLF